VCVGGVCVCVGCVCVFDCVRVCGCVVYFSVCVRFVCGCVECVQGFLNLCICVCVCVCVCVSEWCVYEGVRVVFV